MLDLHLTALAPTRTLILYMCSTSTFGKIEMPVHTTYTQARANLAKLCDAVVQRRETVIIRRRAAEDVALVSAAELESLIETAHLLRSPKNAERLLKALDRARRRKGVPRSMEGLRKEIELEETD
ncbi:type II toxin-antitoxin system prevent-host-death family antitoxin [soil metagenome]